MSLIDEYQAAGENEDHAFRFWKDHFENTAIGYLGGFDIFRDRPGEDPLPEIQDHIVSLIIDQRSYAETDASLKNFFRRSIFTKILELNRNYKSRNKKFSTISLDSLKESGSNPGSFQSPLPNIKSEDSSARIARLRLLEIIEDLTSPDPEDDLLMLVGNMAFQMRMFQGIKTMTAVADQLIHLRLAENRQQIFYAFRKASKSLMENIKVKYEKDPSFQDLLDLAGFSNLFEDSEGEN